MPDIASGSSPVPVAPAPEAVVMVPAEVLVLAAQIPAADLIGVQVKTIGVLIK